MNRDKVVQLLGYRLGSRTDLDDRIILEMDMVQTYNLEGTGAFLPWFLETEIATVTVAVDEERLALPADFLGEIEEQALWLYDESSEGAPYTALIKEDYDYLLRKFPAAGVPSHYALSADYILLKPTPDDNYVLKMRYYAADESVLTGDIENKWLKHAADLVIAETGAVMAKHLRNPKLMAEFKEDAAIARERLYKKHEARRHSNRTYGMGED